jgi:UTP pyrophosphatase
MNKRHVDYLGGYPPDLVESVQQMIRQEKLASWLLRKYPAAHSLRTDRALYDYVLDIKNQHMRNVGQVSKVTYDSKMHVIRNALGMHTKISRVQGGNLKSKREIHIAAVFREMPLDFLRMIVVHELAHFKESAHDKRFYQFCLYMEPSYHQMEFDVRAYLNYLSTGGEPLWVDVAKTC